MQAKHGMLVFYSNDVPNSDFRSGKGDGMEKVCCVCSRVKLEQSWVKDVKRIAMVKPSHGYCPDCYREAMQKVMSLGSHFQPAID